MTKCDRSTALLTDTKILAEKSHYNPITLMYVYRGWGHTLHDH